MIFIQKEESQSEQSEKYTENFGEIKKNASDISNGTKVFSSRCYIFMCVSQRYTHTQF